jgi:hypothetical protein
VNEADGKDARTVPLFTSAELDPETDHDADDEAEERDPKPGPERDRYPRLVLGERRGRRLCAGKSQHESDGQRRCAGTMDGIPDPRQAVRSDTE